MDRTEFLPALYRGPDGEVRETEFPKREPDTYDVPADLYCGSYTVRKGWFGPPRIASLEVTIFNTRTYRPDAGLEERAKDRLIEAIVSKEGSEVVQASGGLGSLRERIAVDTWWGPPEG